MVLLVLPLYHPLYHPPTMPPPSLSLPARRVTPTPYPDPSQGDLLSETRHVEGDSALRARADDHAMRG